MNIHFEQVERKSPLSSYLLAAFAVVTMLMLALSISRVAELRLSVPSVSVETTQTEHNVAPVAIPAPLPPAEQAQPIATPEPIGTVPVISVPQVIPAPAPSVP